MVHVVPMVPRGLEQTGQTGLEWLPVGGLLGLAKVSSKSPSSRHVFPQQPVQLCGRRYVGPQGRVQAMLSVRTRGRSRGPRQDMRGEEGSKASRWPCSQSWSCRQMVCMFEKSKPGFLQTCGVPWRALPRQLLAQVMQIGQGVKK